MAVCSSSVKERKIHERGRKNRGLTRVKIGMPFCSRKIQKPSADRLYHRIEDHRAYIAHEMEKWSRSSIMDGKLRGPVGDFYKAAPEVITQYCSEAFDILKAENKADTPASQFNLAMDLYGTSYNMYQIKFYLERAIEANPKSSEAYFYLADLYREDLGDIEKARQYYDKSIEIEPDVPSAHNNLANLLVDYYDDYEEAWYHYNRAIELDEENARYHFNLALLLKEHFEEFEATKYLFEKAIELDPDYAKAHYHLALLLKENGRNLKEMKLHLRKAKELDPTLPDVI